MAGIQTIDPALCCDNIEVDEYIGDVTWGR